NYLFGFFGGGKLGFVNNILYLHHSFAAGFFLQVFNQLVAGIFGRQTCNGFQLFYVLVFKRVNIFLLFNGNFGLPFQVLAHIIKLVLFARKVFQLLVVRLLFLFDAVLTLVYLVIFLIDALLMLGFQL